MKILIVVPYFVPEIGSAAHIYFDLAKAFVKRGHEVDVITSYPRKFNLDMKDLYRDFPIEETLNGINIHRYKYSLVKRDNVFFRGMEHFLLPIYYFNIYKKIDKKFDVCLINIPPLPLYYFARKIKGKDGTPSVLNFQDYHPQELIDVGMLKNKLMIWLMEYIERQSYKNADNITVISKSGIDFIVRRGGDSDKITCIYNSVDISDFEKYTAKKDFKIKEKIENKILVSFAGTLSHFQGLDDVLDAAKKMNEHKDIVFYIVGDGMIKDHLIDRVYTENIHNVRIMPYKPRDEYFNIINSSDISIVSLDKRMNTPVLPGKFMNLLGVGQPILANVPSCNDVAFIVKNSNCGIVTEPENVDQMVNAIIKFKEDAEFRKECGPRGRQFMEKEMNLEKNVLKYEDVFKSMLRNDRI